MLLKGPAGGCGGACTALRLCGWFAALVPVCMCLIVAHQHRQNVAQS